MRFEKWQALGNDYVIVEAARLEAPLTPETVRRVCDRHAGVGADGVLELSEPDERGYVARVRIFNPDGSEAELSGNGVRQAILYLRARGWTDADRFSVQTIAGEIRPTILSDTTCRVDMGRARADLARLPLGPARRRRRADRRRAHVALPARLDRQPAVRDRACGPGRGRRARRRGARSRRSSTPRSSRAGRT